MLLDRVASRWDTLAFLACLALSVVARLAPDPIQTGIASAVRRTVLAPFLAIQHQAELFKTSRTRLSEIVAERDAAARAALDVVALREENLQLRRLLDLDARVTAPHVAAEVLHQTSPADGLTLLLTAGSADGVQPLAPVITPQGLLGVVRSASPRQSIAVSWPHPDFRASAMALDGTVFGIVAARGALGPNAPLMELNGVPFGVNVPEGTALYTAGFGGVYPRGIPLGVVVGVADEVEGLSRTYLVRPAVHPAAVTHAIILTRTVADVSDAFEGATR